MTSKKLWGLLTALALLAGFAAGGAIIGVALLGGHGAILGVLTGVFALHAIVKHPPPGWRE